MTERFHPIRFQGRAEIAWQVGVARGYLKGCSGGRELAVVGALPCDNLALALERRMRPRDLDEEGAERAIPTDGNRRTGRSWRRGRAGCDPSARHPAGRERNVCRIG